MENNIEIIDTKWQI